MTKKSIVLFGLIILSLGGCISLREQMLNRGFPAAYVDGYEQGRASGYVAAGHPYYQFQKEPYRFEQDSQYRQGWNDGFQVAKGSYESLHHH